MPRKIEKNRIFRYNVPPYTYSVLVLSVDSELCQSTGCDRYFYQGVACGQQLGTGLVIDTRERAFRIKDGVKLFNILPEICLGDVGHWEDITDEWEDITDETEKEEQTDCTVLDQVK